MGHHVSHRRTVPDFMKLGRKLKAIQHGILPCPISLCVSPINRLHVKVHQARSSSQRQREENQIEWDEFAPVVEYEFRRFSQVWIFGKMMKPWELWLVEICSSASGKRYAKNERPVLGPHD